MTFANAGDAMSNGNWNLGRCLTGWVLLLETWVSLWVACFLSGMGKELAPWCVQTNKLAWFLRASHVVGCLVALTAGNAKQWLLWSLVLVANGTWARSDDDELEKDDIPIERGCEKLYWLKFSCRQGVAQLW